MKVTCTGRRVSLKPSFIEKAEKRLAKLDKFFPEETQAQVTVTVEKSRQTVEITVYDNGITVRAEKTADQMEAALEDAADLLTRRLVKNRKRLSTKMTRAAEWPADPEPEETFEVIREKRFAVKPCTTEEAILQMNLLEHTFFAFRNEDADGAFAVVYKRNDGGYGLIEDEE